MSIDQGCQLRQDLQPPLRAWLCALGVRKPRLPGTGPRPCETVTDGEVLYLRGALDVQFVI